MSRPAWVEIDLAALQANYAAAKKAHGGRVFAVLKANAYGHGALACAQALATASPPADAFAVAFVEEALPLRAAGITQPILVLEGAFAADDVQLAAQHHLWLVAHQAQQLQLIEQHAGAALHIWLKVDSGMHRVGFAPHDIAAAHARLAALPQVEKVSFLTHLARADELDTPAPTEAQLHAFHTATANLAGWRSISNSAAILAWPQ
ncbi:MAG TPA: alanine racemase, partial [Comamonas denitrificans]|nr:alanine racemase [Comamonas denitrificans]